MKLDLSGKIYLVVGASSGIGRQSAIEISKQGGRVVLTGRNVDRLNETYSVLEGNNHIIMPFDMSDINNIKGFIKECLKAMEGKFDGMVFSAGLARTSPIRTEKLEEMESFFRLSYMSYAALLKEFASTRALKNGGSIVAISSRAALFPEKGSCSYATAKAAINTTSIVAANELATRKIRVNTICPEMVNTAMTRYFFDFVEEEKINDLYPLGALEAEDVADMIIFLLSDMSKKITGQVFHLSAGNTGAQIYE